MNSEYLAVFVWSRSLEHHCLSALSLSVSLYACLQQPNLIMYKCICSKVFSVKKKKKNEQENEFIHNDTGKLPLVFVMFCFQQLFESMWKWDCWFVPYAALPSHKHIRTKRLHEWHSLYYGTAVHVLKLHPSTVQWL